MKNPLITILSNDKLTGDNFVKWKSTMNIVLVSENQKFVLIDQCPNRPALNASQEVKEKYDKWIDVDEKAYYYLLAGMCEVLRAKHEKMKTAKEMWDSLQSMFGKPFEKSRHDAVKAIINARMKNGLQFVSIYLK